MERPRDHRLVTRRHFLYLSAASVVGLVATACGGDAPATSTTAVQPTTAARQPTAAPQPTAIGQPVPTGARPIEQPTPPPRPTAAAAAPRSYKEPPLLAEQVKQGKLPPVEQRLPKEPMVIAPNDKVGQYGGAWRTGLVGSGDTPWLSRTIGYESLVRWDKDWKQLVPDLARKFEVSPDGKVYTFTLREGIKWSDGQPFTADDFVFWYEDVVLNPELTKANPSWFTTAGKVGKVEKVDQHTFKMVFEQPHGTLLKRLAMNGAGLFIIPAHYAKRFHVKYNRDGVEKMVADQKLADWAALYHKMAGVTQGIGDARWYNPELPTLFGWAITSPYGAGTRMVAQRNPYYWKVDTAGNQLPYLDEVAYDMVNETEVLTLKALNGEIEMMDRHIATPANKPVFTDNQGQGQLPLLHHDPGQHEHLHRAVQLQPQGSGPAGDHPEPEVPHRPVARDQPAGDHRRGLRRPGAALAGRPEEGVALLPRAARHAVPGVQRRQGQPTARRGRADQEGRRRPRLRPDGKPLQMTWEVVGNNQPWIDTANLIKKHWRAVGVDINVKPEERALRQQRVKAYEHDVTNWGGDGGIDAILGPYWYLAYASFNSFAPGWALWYENDGKAGEEPTPPAKRQMELYDQIQITPDDGKQKELMKQLLDIAAEQFWIMGISLPANGYGIVKNNFFNVPEQMFASGQEFSNPGATMPEQYFIAK